MVANPEVIKHKMKKSQRPGALPLRTPHPSQPTFFPAVNTRRHVHPVSIP